MDELTPEQKIAFQNFRDKSIEFFKNPTEISDEKLEASLVNIYKNGGNEPPTLGFYWFDGPLSLSIGYTWAKEFFWHKLIANAASLKIETKEDLLTDTYSRFSRVVLTNFSNFLAREYNARQDYSPKLNDPVLVEAALDKASDTIMQEFNDMGLQFDYRKFYTDALKNIPDRFSHVPNIILGVYDSYWINFYLSLRSILNVDFKEKSEQLDDWANTIHSGWIATFQHVCMVSRLPVRHFLDENLNLFNETGPVIEFRDGTEIYMLEGIQVPRKCVTNPELITLQEIETETNAELRRILLEKYGRFKYVKDCNARVIDVDYEGAEEGSCPRCLFELPNGSKVLMGSDGSTGRAYIMDVDSEAKTCVEAHESICGFNESDIKLKS